MTGAEPFIIGALKGFLASKAAEKAQESIASELTKSAWSSGAAQVKPGTLTDQLKQQIFNASGQYISSYADRHGILKVLGMMEPVWIEDIYTRVQFLGDDSIRQYLSLENLEQAYRETQQRRFQFEECEKRDGVEVANQQQYLMVLGQPGAGKSTFLRRIGLEALKREESDYGHNSIPVFLELKRFNTGTVDIEQAIAREFETCNFPDPARSAKRLLEDGKLLLLLDGLDEVPTQQMDQAITQIQDFCDRYSQNRFIASCRTAAYRSRFRQFRDVIMADFDDEQIQQFITNWFRSKDDQELDTAQKCWDLLQQPEYAATRELAQTPLLLTFLCLVFDDAQTFPKQRAILYKDALDVLLKRWAAEKRIQRDPIYQNLTLPLEEMMLAEIAYTGFEADRLFFSGREVVEQIRTFLASNLNAPKYLDGDEILNAIQVQQGVLVERARDVLSFSHLTLQEYLTAQHIVDNDLIEQLVANHLCDRRWQEVFLLIVGLMRGGADKLLLQIEAKTWELLNVDKLKKLLRWTDQSTGELNEFFPSLLKRIFRLLLAFPLEVRAGVLESSNIYWISQGCPSSLNALCRALKRHPRSAEYLTYSYALSRELILNQLNIDALNQASRDFARKYSLETIIKDELVDSDISKPLNLNSLLAKLRDIELEASQLEVTEELRQKLLQNSISVWFTGINLDPEIARLTEEESDNLKRYLYANELMVRCKEAAVRVSPQVWAGIEERMLTVRDEG